jgi:hypothetical protein
MNASKDGSKQNRWHSNDTGTAGVSPASSNTFAQSGLNLSTLADWHSTEAGETPAVPRDHLTLTTFTKAYSALNASIGSKPAARHAGYTPEIKPTLADTIRAAVTAKKGKTVGTGVRIATNFASA